MILNLTEHSVYNYDSQCSDFEALGGDYLTRYPGRTSENFEVFLAPEEKQLWMGVPGSVVLVPICIYFIVCDYESKSCVRGTRDA